MRRRIELSMMTDNKRSIESVPQTLLAPVAHIVDATVQLPRLLKVVLVVDLVESVRMMHNDEAGVVSLWREFVHEARATVLPAHSGRLVKSLGDGLMAEFDLVPSAIQASQALHALMEKLNKQKKYAEPLQLRAGLHSTQVYVDDIDIYGSGVNLAARIATLAQPGETIVTAAVRDGLTDGIDAYVEDLGECYLKHIEQPVRAYRIGTSNALKIMHATPADTMQMQIAVAVMPFDDLQTTHDMPHEHMAIANLLADGVIAQISRSPELRVLSRLSCLALRGRRLSVGDMGALLGAQYVLSGSYVWHNARLHVSSELAAVKTGEVVWAHRQQADLSDLLAANSQLCHDIADGVHQSILDAEVQKSLTQPLPTLQSSSLMFAAINLMHHSSHTDAKRSLEMLEHLQTRHQRHYAPASWLANWYALRVTQGQSNEPAQDTQRALSYAQSALEANPSSTLAMSIYGALLANLKRDATGAMTQLDNAVRINPSEALAWLYKGLIHSYQAEAPQALLAAEKALALTPVNPMRHYYESLAASCALGALDFDRAITLAQSSLRMNRLHPSTYRALAIAQALSGRVDDGKKTLEQLLQLTPGYRQKDFLERSGFATGVHATTFTQALAEVGLPQ
jgi:adenylate cyclase